MTGTGTSAHPGRVAGSSRDWAVGPYREGLGDGALATCSNPTCESNLVWPLATFTDPVVRNWLGLPSVAGLALIFAFLRKELALQLLVSLAVVQFGPQAANLARFMSPAQLFTYATVVSVSVPCVATFAALRAEHGWRPALAMSAGSLAIALGAGGLIARVLSAA